MRRVRRGSWLVALLLILALVAAACGSDDDDDEGGATGTTAEKSEGAAKTGGDLIDFQNFANGEPDHIDPALSSTIQGSQPGQLLFDGLTENDYETGELVPNVAERWESNEDATEWTFHLRDGVKFHNGDPVLPSDFKFAWERVVQPEMASDVAYHLDPIQGKKDVDEGKTKELSGVVADDDEMTLTVKLAFPYSVFPATTSHLVFSPVPKNAFADVADQKQWEQGIMIGNGPFKMAEPWKHEQYIKLARFDDYWGGPNDHKAYLDTIEFRISKDLDSAFADFEAGNGDTGYIPPGRFAEATAKYPNATNATLGIYVWQFNMEDPVVGGEENLKLRQAIALAIDKKAIIDTSYSGSRKVATGITPPGIPGYEEGSCEVCTKDGKPDLPRAKKLLSEWESATGKKAGDLPPLKLNFGAGAGHEPNATIIQANLKELGINSELAGSDSTTYFKDMRGGKGQFLRAGWIWDYVAYDNGMFPLFHSESIGGDNLSRLSDPEVDKLINEARAETDEDKSFELYREAEARILNENTSYIPLNWYTGQIVYRDSVKGFRQSPLQFVDYAEIYLDK